MKLIIVSGRSGAGKSVVLNVLEDLDYYCIDNLPIQWIFNLKEALSPYHSKVAISIDSRNIGHDTAILETLLLKLSEVFEDKTIIFLDAADETLLKRFSETRRKHPLTDQNLSLKEALQQEQVLLRPLIDQADLRIDTTSLNIRDLRQMIYRFQKEEAQLSMLFQSFGYKNGIPLDTDFIFDVRCLPNPHWEKALQFKTGTDPEVIQYLQQFSSVETMYQDIQNFIAHWLPAFQSENRKYLSIAIGCTGGQHRSVYLAEKLHQYFKQQGHITTVRHRDIRS